MSTVHAGASLPLRARIDLAGLAPTDVRVEALVGRIGAQGELEEAQVLTLDPWNNKEPCFCLGGLLPRSPPGGWDFPSA